MLKEKLLLKNENTKQNKSNNFDLNKVNYIIKGEGLPVLLFGGQFMSIEGWKPIMEDLSRYYKVIALELPNQGTSPTNLDFLCLKDYAGFANSFLDSIDIDTKEIAVFGLSFGANIIRSLVLDFGKDFKTIILGGVGPFDMCNDRIKSFKKYKTMIRDGQLELFTRKMNKRTLSEQFRSQQPDFVDFAIKKINDFYGHRPEALMTLIKSQLNYFSNNEIKKEIYPCDVHIIAAKDDSTVSLSFVKDYAKQLNATLHKIEGGHAFIVENSFDFIDKMHDILEYYE